MNTYDIDLVLTCYAYPEQYAALDKDGNCIAHLRLRNGVFTVECPDVGGECAYCAEPQGNGIFEYNEREMYLNAAKQAIVQYYNRPKEGIAKKKYCVTIARYGCLFVEAESEDEAMDIADHQTTDTVIWSDDWAPTDVQEDDSEPDSMYITEKAFE